MRPGGRSKPSLLFTLLRRQDFCAGRKQPSKSPLNKAPIIKVLDFGGLKGSVFRSLVWARDIAIFSALLVKRGYGAKDRHDQKCSLFLGC